MSDDKQTVGSVAEAAIKSGKNNEEALEAVKEAFPDAKTSLASINWYRNKLRSTKTKGDNGKLVPTARELKKATKKKDPLDT